MKAEQFIRQFNVFSREGQCKPASSSEIQRWLLAGNVQVNGEQMLSRELVDFPVFSLVLFPGGKRVTLK